MWNFSLLFRCSFNRGKNSRNKRNVFIWMIHRAVVSVWNIDMKSSFFVWRIIEPVCNTKRNIRKMWRKSKSLCQVSYDIWLQKKLKQTRRWLVFSVWMSILSLFVSKTRPLTLIPKKENQQREQNNQHSICSFRSSKPIAGRTKLKFGWNGELRRSGNG